MSGRIEGQEAKVRNSRQAGAGRAPPEPTYQHTPDPDAPPGPYVQALLTDPAFCALPHDYRSGSATFLTAEQMAAMLRIPRVASDPARFTHEVLCESHLIFNLSPDAVVLVMATLGKKRAFDAANEFLSVFGPGFESFSVGGLLSFRKAYNDSAQDAPVQSYVEFASVILKGMTAGLFERPATREQILEGRSDRSQVEAQMAVIDEVSRQKATGSDTRRFKGTFEDGWEEGWEADP